MSEATMDDANYNQQFFLTAFLDNLLTVSFKPWDFFAEQTNRRTSWYQAILVILLYSTLVSSYFGLVSFPTDGDSVLQTLIVIIVPTLFVYGVASGSLWLFFGKQVNPLELGGWLQAPYLIYILLVILINLIGTFLNVAPSTLISFLFQFRSLPLFRFTLLLLPIVWPVWILYFAVEENCPERKIYYWFWSAGFIVLIISMSEFRRLF